MGTVNFDCHKKQRVIDNEMRPIDGGREKARLYCQFEIELPPRHFTPSNEPEWRTEFWHRGKHLLIFYTRLSPTKGTSVLIMATSFIL